MASKDPAKAPAPSIDAADQVQGQRLRSDEGGPDGATDAQEDTRAYGRPSAEPEEGRVLPPRVAGTSGSPLEGLLQIPVLTVQTAVRPPPPPAAPPPDPAEPSPIPRVTILSSPGPGQVCPVCKGPLRVLRTTREDRLECTWFRLEWLEVERDLADCPAHPTLETVPLHRPAFALPESPLGNGLLARIGTWRWQDHMPGHDLSRLLVSLGLRCTESHVSRWLQAAGAQLAPVAAAIRQRCAGGTTDPLGIIVVDGAAGSSPVEGRLRATTRGALVAFDWTAGSEGPRPDTPEERARRVLLDARGWSRAGRQANLRRIAARALATDRDRAARVSWILEELRAAADPAAEKAAMDRVLGVLGRADQADPHLLLAARSLAADGPEGLLRLGKGGPNPDPPRPENVRAVLPRWFLSLGDGGAAQVADWLTVMESCAAAGVPPWRYLRDLFEARADAGAAAFDAARWVPTRPG